MLKLQRWPYYLSKCYIQADYSNITAKANVSESINIKCYARAVYVILTARAVI